MLLYIIIIYNHIQKSQRKSTLLYKLNIHHLFYRITDFHFLFKNVNK